MVKRWSDGQCVSIAGVPEVKPMRSGEGRGGFMDCPGSNQLLNLQVPFLHSMEARVFLSLDPDLYLNSKVSIDFFFRKSAIHWQDLRS